MSNTFSFEDASKPAQETPSKAPSPKSFSFEEASGSPKPKGFAGHARDLGISALQSAIGVPELAVGLADIPTGGAVGKALENKDGAFGFRPKQARDYLDTLRTEAGQQQQRDFEQADGIAGKAAYALQNPSLIANTVVGSLGQMVAGGLIGRGVMAVAPKLGAAVAAGAGEGVAAAGSTAEQIRQETKDGELTAGQSALALGAGAATGAFGVAGAKVARKMGIADADTLMVQGAKGMAADAAQQAAVKGIPRKVIEGAIAEGFLEELPQSVSEQVLQNIALNKDWSEGVDSAVVLGVLSGMAMGGGAAGLQGSSQSRAAAGAQEAPTLVLPAPTYTGTPSDQMLQAEAERANAVAQAEARVADLYRQRADFEAAGAQNKELSEEERATLAVTGDILQNDPNFGGWARREIDPARKEARYFYPDGQVRTLFKDGAETTYGADSQAPADIRQTIEDTTGISGRAAPGGSRLKDLKAAFDEQIEPQVIIDTAGKVTATTNKLEFQQFQADYDNRVALRQRNIEAGRRLHAAKAGINPDDGPLSTGAAIALESAASGPQDLSPVAEGEAPTPAADPQAAPTGSFGAMNDFADLLSQERQDVAQRRAGIAERQGQRREFDLAEADRRTAESMQQEAQARRRAVLDAVLADPETTNPAGRFAATLRREGYRDSAPTADELQTIQRFEDVRAAKPAPLEVEPSAPNELDPAAMGIRERRAPAEKAPLAPPKNLREGLERARAVRAAAAVPAAQVVPPAAAPSLNPGDAWARMDAGQRTALAGRLQGVPPIVSKNVHRADWAKINPALQGKLAEAMAPRAATPIEGADLGDGWAAFRPESGTVGVPRAEMPQIKAEHRGAMVNFMNARGVQHQEETVPAASLKPTQAEFSREKVARAKAFDGGSRSILVSADNHVLDGHHQWMAARDKGEDVKVIRLDAPIRDLVGLAHDFPSSTTARGSAGEAVASPATPVEKALKNAQPQPETRVVAGAAGGGQRGESASPAVGQALQILMDRTDGVGAPDGLGGPEHADARTAIVSALTGARAADIEAAPNFKFRTSVPQVERLLYDAAGIPAGKTLKDRRGPFMDWLDLQQAGGAAQASPESTARAEALDQEMARKLQEAESGDTTAEQDAPAAGLQFSRGGGQDGEFVAAPDGSIDFGEITPEMAQAMRRQAGKIRLERGDYTYGLEHIEARHGDQIRAIGFESVEAFVADAVRHIDSIWLPTKTSQLVVLQSEERGKAVFIELKPAESGDYYTVNTAFPVGEGYAQGKEKRGGWRELWSREPVPASTPGGQSDSASTPLKAGEVPSMDRGQSSDTSVANPDAAGSPTAQKSAVPALPRPTITAESLPAIFTERFPKLASAIRTMMDRGALGQPGGLVVIGNAQEFADHSGRKLDDAVQLFESGDGIHIKGLYDKKTGITYLVGPNLTQDSASAVVLHEMVHGQQRQALDQKALALIEGRAKEAPALRAFLDRVAARMEAVGEAGNPFEATSYIVEMAAQEGRQSGFSRADGPILAWIEHNIGRKVADMVRGFVATVRAWALAYGVELKAITVDDLVAYATAGVGKAARGKVVTDGKAGLAPAFSRGSPEGTGVGRVAERLRDTTARAAGRPRPDPNDPFSAENTRLREQDKSLWQKAKGQLRRWLAPGGLLPDSVFAEKIARDSNFQAVEFDVRHIVGGFEQAVKQDFGVPFDKLTQAQQRTLSEALAGKVSGSLPAATKTAAVAMRQYIDSLSGEYLQIIQGKIDALQARAEQSGRDADKAQAINEIGLYEKIRNNVGAYVHRSYQAFDDPKWFQKVPTATLNAARQYLKGGYMEGGKASEAEALRLAEVALNEILKNGTAYDSMESFIAEGKLGAKDLSVLMRRKDVPPVIRALLGEYTDPRLNFTKSATKMGRLIWNQRFLDRVREMGMGTFLFEGKDRPPSATTQIAAQGSEVYAPLNGLWTFPEVAQSFKDALGTEQMGELYRFIVRANGLVKYGKTVLSPTTAMRNWQSAMFFALANGHFDLTQMKKSVAAFREQVRQNATDGDLAYLRHLKELGVVYDTPYAGEMMHFIEDAKADSGVDTVMRAFGASDGAIAKGLRGVKQINQVAQGFYSFGDDFWKIIGFENEKAGLLKAGLPVAEAEREAAKRIRDTYPTYSMVGAGIQKLSRFPLMGTFVSFPAEIVRTSANMLRTTAADLKSDNPALRALGMKRAVGMAMVSGLFYGLAALSKAGSGVDDDEEEALRDLAPEWQKNSTFLFAGRDEKGQLRYFDMSFLDPYGYWKRPITAMLRDQPWEKSAASAIKDMLTPFFGADIATAAIFQVLANKKDSGGKVYQEGADALDQTGAIANHLRKALQPGFVGNIERLTLAAQGMRREGSGQPYDLNDEITALLGWRARAIALIRHAPG